MEASSADQRSDEFTRLRLSDQEDKEDTSKWVQPNQRRWLAGVAVSIFAAICVGITAAALYHWFRLPAQHSSAPNVEILDLGHEYFEKEEYLVVQSAVSKLLDAGALHIIVACFTPSLVDITNNWVCSLASDSGNVAKAAVLLFAIDGSCDGLTTGFQDAGGTLICVPVQTKPPPRALVEYGSERYTFMCGAKLALFSWAMRAVDTVDTGGKGTSWILFSDVDIVVRRDLFAYLESHIHSPDVRDGHWRSPKPPEVVFQRIKPTTGFMNTGFYFARAGIVALKMFKGALEYLQAGNTTDGADQGAIQLFLNDTKEVEEWPVGLLPGALFPNGDIYFHSNGLNVSDDWIVLHANYIPDSDGKRQCLRITGNWFLDETSDGTCVVPNKTKDWIFKPGGKIPLDPPHRNIRGPCAFPKNASLERD